MIIICGLQKAPFSEQRICSATISSLFLPVKLGHFRLPVITCQTITRPKHHILLFLNNRGIMSSTHPRKRIILAITGATGAQIGIHILQALRRLNVETHLVISKWAAETIKLETDYTVATVRALADHSYSPYDLSAPIASGSYRVDGMIVAPCSVKTLAAINAGICDDLITRAADVCLKERKKLVLSVRETPLSEIHLRNMLEVTRAGAIVTPPVVGFYTRPATVEDVLNQMCGRLLDLFDLDSGDFPRWEGLKKGE